ncbi:MAG: hypothetical protein E7434_07240 [Ruminococcaceae bacterium]|nr:hypothetical protein [Oscillospiraceae bacterium]
MDESKDIFSLPEEKAPKNSLRKTRHNKKLPMIFAFLLPFLLSTIAYLIALLTTDGTNMLLSSDGWHQYYPFLVDLREKLLAGGSMQYSWTVGMGGSYPSLYAYYLASPLNFLSVFVSTDLLPHYFTVMTILKLSFAGLFMAWFLRIAYRRNDMSLPFFGILYAFCAWASGYYWNLMWLDVFALLPLLVAGTVSLLRDGKFRLYIISLALSLWCNYYVAFFCCIFVLLCFIGFCICKWNGFGNFVRRFLRIGICTLIGAGIACVLLIPTLLAMQTTNSAVAKEFELFALNIAEDASGLYTTYDSLWSMLAENTFPKIFASIGEVLSGLMPATTPTDMDGLPNVFCGLSSVMLAVYYFCCKKISGREKFFNFSLLLFLTLSFILRFLDYIWHGFHFPNMLPYRFSFLFSFVLIAMAYRAYTLMDDFKLIHLTAILPITALLIYNAFTQEDFTTLQLVMSICVFAATLAFFLLHFFLKKIKQPQNSRSMRIWQNRKAFAAAGLFMVFMCEMVLGFSYGIDAVGLTSQYDASGNLSYPRKGENVQALLNYLDEKEDDPLFYRTETTGTQTLNDAALNGYNGVSIFNSSTNANFNRLSRSLGLASWVGSNRFIYYESSPFTNTMCGIKYLIDRTDSHYNTDYNALLAESGGVNLLENRAFISVGFMADSALQEFVAEDAKYNPIWEQEEMFRLATGIEEDLYTHYTAEEFDKPFDATIRATGTSGTQYSYTTNDSASKYQDISIIYTVKEDGLYLATTLRPTKAESKIDIYCNNKKMFTIEAKVRMLFSLGNFKAGDKVKVVYSVASGQDGNISLDFAKQNNAVFDAGYEKLADEPFILTEFSDGYLKGTVDALSDGLFYTSVPYEPGWRAYVDGKEVPLAEGYHAQNKAVNLTDAVVCFPLSAGAHEIELLYSAPGGTLGLIITVISLLAFIGLCILLKKDFVLLPDMQTEAKPTAALKKLLSCAIGVTIFDVILILAAFLGAKFGFPVWSNKADLLFLILAFAIYLVSAIVLKLWFQAARSRPQKITDETTE